LKKIKFFRLANQSQDLFCGILDFEIQKDQSFRTKVIPLKPLAVSEVVDTSKHRKQT
jgi:hypothetical protein